MWSVPFFYVKNSKTKQKKHYSVVNFMVYNYAVDTSYESFSESWAGLLEGHTMSVEPLLYRMGLSNDY